MMGSSLVKVVRRPRSEVASKDTKLPHRGACPCAQGEVRLPIDSLDPDGPFIRPTGEPELVTTQRHQRDGGAVVHDQSQLSIVDVEGYISARILWTLEVALLLGPVQEGGRHG